MNQRILSIAVLLFALAFAVYLFEHARRSTSESAHATIGLVVPDFSLPDLNGALIDLSTYRGKVVLLDFWATWCDPCRGEIPHFVRLQDKYRDQGFQIIGVSMDDGPEPVRDFYRRFNMNYPVVMGNAKIGELYGGVLGLPIAFLIRRDGRIFTKHIGAIDTSVFEKELVMLLRSRSDFGRSSR